jgi:hypothetical protein
VPVYADDVTRSYYRSLWDSETAAVDGGEWMGAFTEIAGNFGEADRTRTTSAVDNVR